MKVYIKSLDIKYSLHHILPKTNCKVQLFVYGIIEYTTKRLK